VETLFHEFGHALQHMMTTVDEGLVAGIRCGTIFKLQYAWALLFWQGAGSTCVFLDMLQPLLVCLWLQGQEWGIGHLCCWHLQAST
jgi:hypothetical protein